MREENLDRALEHLNDLASGAAQAELRKCCGSLEWARRMAAARPFQDTREVFENADRIWWALDAKDWLEAFSRHPKIGEKKAARPVAKESQKWSEEEQAGASLASKETINALDAANREYENKFGYIFIVCATGKSSGEMLALLKERINNDPDTELRIAAGEQRRITQLRLQKLLDLEK